MAVKVFWIPGPWPGKLGIVPRPRGGDWLADEMKAWREAGIDAVVSLLEPEEEAQLVLDAEATAASASGVEFIAFPIPDRGVPSSLQSMAALTGRIVEALEGGRNVSVHCRQGIGRSALTAGAVLVAAGESPDSAFATIKEARGVEVPETEEQRRWLGDFAASLPAPTAPERSLHVDHLRRHRI